MQLPSRWPSTKSLTGLYTLPFWEVPFVFVCSLFTWYTLLKYILDVDIRSSGELVFAVLSLKTVYTVFILFGVLTSFIFPRSARPFELFQLVL